MKPEWKIEIGATPITITNYDAFNILCDKYTTTQCSILAIDINNISGKYKTSISNYDEMKFYVRYVGDSWHQVFGGMLDKIAYRKSGQGDSLHLECRSYEQKFFFKNINKSYTYVCVEDIIKDIVDQVNTNIATNFTYANVGNSYYQTSSDYDTGKIYQTSGGTWTAGQTFKPPRSSVITIGVRAARTGTPNNLVCGLYKWDTNYATTIAGSCLASDSYTYAEIKEGASTTPDCEVLFVLDAVGLVENDIYLLDFATESTSDNNNYYIIAENSSGGLADVSLYEGGVIVSGEDLYIKVNSFVLDIKDQDAFITMRDICSRLSYDWYSDYSKDINIMAKNVVAGGSIVAGKDILSIEYIRDIVPIANSISVIGSEYRIVHPDESDSLTEPDDQAWVDNNWEYTKHGTVPGSEALSAGDDANNDVYMINEGGEQAIGTKYVELQCVDHIQDDCIGYPKSNSITGEAIAADDKKKVFNLSNEYIDSGIVVKRDGTPWGTEGTDWFMDYEEGLIWFASVLSTAYTWTTDYDFSIVNSKYRVLSFILRAADTTSDLPIKIRAIVKTYDVDGNSDTFWQDLMVDDTTWKLFELILPTLENTYDWTGVSNIGKRWNRIRYVALCARTRDSGSTGDTNDSSAIYEAYNSGTVTNTVGQAFVCNDTRIKFITLKVKKVNNPGSSFAIAIYKWNTDYATTIAGTRLQFCNVQAADIPTSATVMRFDMEGIGYACDLEEGSTYIIHITSISDEDASNYYMVRRGTSTNDNGKYWSSGVEQGDSLYFEIEYANRHATSIGVDGLYFLGIDEIIATLEDTTSQGNFDTREYVIREEDIKTVDEAMQKAKRTLRMLGKGSDSWSGTPGDTKDVQNTAVVNVPGSHSYVPGDSVTVKYPNGNLDCDFRIDSVSHNINKMTGWITTIRLAMIFPQMSLQELMNHIIIRLGEASKRRPLQQE